MLHLIFGVAGGIMLAVYGIAYIERQRQARNLKHGLAMLHAAYIPVPTLPPPVEQPGIWPWIGIAIAAIIIVFIGFAIAGIGIAPH